MLRAARRGLAEFSALVKFSGVSLWLAWITIIYSGDPFVADASAAYYYSSLLFTLSTAALAISLVALATKPRVAQAVLGSRAAMAAVAVLGMVSTLVVLFAAYVPFALFSIAALMTGVATSTIALRSAVLFSELDTRNAIIACCGSLAFGVLLYGYSSMMATYSSQMGFNATTGMVALLIPLSIGLLYLEEDDEQKPFDSSDIAFGLPASFRRLVACVIVLSFSFCAIRGYYPSQMDTFQFSASRGFVSTGLLLGCAIIGLIAASMERNASYGKLCYVILLLATCGIVLLPVFGFGSVASGVLGSTLYGVAQLSVWALLARISYRSGSSAVRVFGFGFGAACLATTAGFACGALLAAISVTPGQMAVIGVVLVVASVASALFLLREKDLQALMLPLEDPTAPWEAEERETGVLPETAESNKPMFKYRCERIASDHGLSPRETEVFLLLAKGKDAKSVADELGVSFNTARTHQRNVYTKLDVHSRHELLDLVDENRL